MDDQAVDRRVVLTGAMRKLGRDDPTYFLEVAIEEGEEEIERQWVTYKPAELLSWSKARVTLLAATDEILRLDVPKKMNAQEVWEETLRPILRTVEVVDAPPEASEIGALRESVLQWIAGRPIAKTAMDFGRGNRRYETPEGRVHFRASDLLRALEQAGKVDRRVLWQTLEPVGFENGFVYVVSKSFRSWSVPSNVLARWIAENREGIEEPQAAESPSRLSRITAYSAKNISFKKA